MSMSPHFRSAIEQNYQVELATCIPGPRQFVAQTFILTDVNGRRYFCKLTDKALFIPAIIESLPVNLEMRAKGIERISVPIPGKRGLYLWMGDTLAVLYDYIDAPQTYDYDALALGRLTAEIHKATSRVSCKIPEEDFEFPFRTLFDERFKRILASHAGDPVLQALQLLLRKHKDRIRRCYSELIRLGSLAKSEPCDFVITHGDAPGNVLVKSADDLYIIDWDGILLAPPERDLWMVDHDPRFLEGYRSIQPDLTVSTTRRSFFICKSFFVYIVHILSEVLGHADETYRMSQIRNLKENVLEGWMAPKLRDVIGSA